ncbi:hypothetical protein CEXT_207201 [Caerostris extrusa]|uniref:Uncharacterized protein n=1 Tax=Caerostris extrusa TaxID=172846 RepID=A0AAV4SE39_CAEEX|nr:hypothetical protein CEXT_207201 [Caerostris extrusa]
MFPTRGKANPFHRINTGDQLPVAVPQYRISPILKHFNKTSTSPIRPFKNMVDVLKKKKLDSLCSNDLCWPPPRDIPGDITGGGCDRTSSYALQAAAPYIVQEK